MDETQKAAYFLANCFQPAKLDGAKIDLECVEIPLVGITGLGREHERGGKRSVWVNGQILSPNFRSNNGCASRSQIEGIITVGGDLRVLEAVYNFPAHEGDCFEYNLKVKDRGIKQPLFEGKVISRLRRDSFEPVESGQIYLVLNPFWMRGDTGVTRNDSLPFYEKPYVTGCYTPDFWDTFLGEIEEQGYEHPYVAVTEKLRKERQEKQEAK